MKKNFEEVWFKCLASIRNYIPDQTFTTWFKPISPLKLEDSTLTVQLPSQFFYEFLESHYSVLINQSLIKTLGKDAKLNYSIVVNEKNEMLQMPSHKNRFSVEVDNQSQLSDRYTFDNFVEGSNNQFARAASLAVA
ncbi:MAG: DnaA N-terminal domain-containing protein, partial [Methanosarcinales archaeon]